jgi:hypothetical protein
MYSNNFTITIIDRGNEDRRAGIFNAFQDVVFCQLVYSDDGIIVCRDINDENIEAPTPPNITFLHIRDLDLIQVDKIRPEYGTIENTVFYGGNGGDDPDIPSNAKERIWRVILDKSESVSSEEGIQLRDYFKLPRDQRNDGTRPDILLPPKTFEILPSLSILCQGYLVVCAESEERGKYLDVIKPALEEMGWVDETGNRVIDKGNSLIRENLKGEWGKVQLPNWWYEEVFAWDDLRNKIACECGMNCFSKVDKHIRKLLNNIATTGERIDPLTVAKAYSAIAKVFAEST